VGRRGKKGRGTTSRRAQVEDNSAGEGRGWEKEDVVEEEEEDEEDDGGEEEINMYGGVAYHRTR
jgi:hypothetical protein